MLPTHSSRGRRHRFGTASLLKHLSFAKWWPLLFGLLAVWCIVQSKALQQEKSWTKYAAEIEKKAATAQRLAAEQALLVENIANKIAAVVNATRALEVPGDMDCRSLPPPQVVHQLRQRHRHKMAVIVPYRNREDMLEVFLPSLHNYLQAQGRDFAIFVLEQSPKLRFNRGLLLNAGVALLRGSEYDYFVFHDVDTLPTEAGNMAYDYPSGSAPLHLTPPGIHPRVRYEDFFGGVTAFTQEQIEAANGYGVNFWGWGREDDNMRERLKRAGLWPPERPNVPKRSPRFYFHHLSHRKAAEVRVRNTSIGAREFFEVDPDTPYEDALILSSQPNFLDDYHSGLQNSRFWVKDVQPLRGLAVRYHLDLYCDEALTPWCKAKA